MAISINRRIAVLVGLGKKQDLISKITRTKRTGNVTQAIENMTTNCKALSSSPSTSKKLRKKILKLD
jgi:hypothetical protein